MNNIPLASFLIYTTALIGSASLTRAVDRIPIEDFARSPLYSDMQLSPDGECIAFLNEWNGQSTLCFQEGNSDGSGRWVGKGAIRVDPGKGKFHTGWKDIDSFQWISATRALFYTTVGEQFLYGAAACDRNGRYMMTLGGLEREQVEHQLILGRMISSLDQKSGFVLMEDTSANVSSGRLSPYPDVDRVDTIHGTADKIVRNPGHVMDWYADESGAVRGGLEVDPKTLDLSVLYRSSEADTWKTVHVPGGQENAFVPYGFTQNPDELLVAHVGDAGRWNLTTFNITTGAFGSNIASDDDYDIADTLWSPRFDHMPLNRRYYNPQTHALEGVAYDGDLPRVKWLTDGTGQRQGMLNQALPKTVNFIRNTSKDGQRLLVLAFSDRDPGTYFIFDTKSNSLSAVGARLPWVKPAQMAPMFPIKMKARDGVQLHGYVTLPLDLPRQHLPMVVLVHGGPQARDSWGFDPLVQLLANRGYAVLQINFRGSIGLSETFLQMGRHQIGSAMQTDIDDATQWAIKSGLADPKRVAIVGASYGGYAALWALETRPDLYRCGISMAGVTDWVRLLTNQNRDEESQHARTYWTKQLGDPDADAERLKGVSPVSRAADLHSPLLIIQGNEDLTVPKSQAQEMVDALKKAGHPPETDFIPGLPHAFGNEHQRIEIYRRMTEFLEKNLH